MISKTSRYRNANLFTHDADGRFHFSGLRPRELSRPVPILEHQVAQWERPDVVALHYYDDVERWWLLGDANPEELLVSNLVSEERAGSTILIARDGYR